MTEGLLQYSGLLTKTRAMHGRLLKREDFEKILEIPTVYETIVFLREQESYGKIYGGHEDIQHRGQVEALIHNSILEDYKCLYLFSNQKQRSALALYQKQLQYGASVPEIDTTYFVKTWQSIHKFFTGKMKQVLQEIFGTQIDWLNIMWMYRAKCFFHQQPEEITQMLIPVHYRLKKSEFQQMLDTEKIEEFIHILSNTVYFKGKEALVKMQDDISYHEVMRKMYQKTCSKYPASMAPIFQYFYDKEQEIQHLTTALEGIRYQVPTKDIRELVLSTR
ncbi:MAG: V-type ATPase subunit [Lachnospiraceae bacterium]